MPARIDFEIERAHHMCRIHDTSDQRGNNVHILNIWWILNYTHAMGPDVEKLYSSKASHERRQCMSPNRKGLLMTGNAGRWVSRSVASNRLLIIAGQTRRINDVNSQFFIFDICIRLMAPCLPFKSNFRFYYNTRCLSMAYRFRHQNTKIDSFVFETNVFSKLFSFIFFIANGITHYEAKCRCSLAFPFRAHNWNQHFEIKC